LGARDRKPMCHAVKQSDPSHHVDQVMIQVELPPYRRPHSLLDLVAFEIACLRHFTGCCRLEQMQLFLRLLMMISLCKKAMKVTTRKEDVGAEVGLHFSSLCFACCCTDMHHNVGRRVLPRCRRLRNNNLWLLI
jgi:hypothetical protein